MAKEAHSNTGCRRPEAGAAPDHPASRSSPRRARTSRPRHHNAYPFQVNLLARQGADQGGGRGAVQRAASRRCGRRTAWARRRRYRLRDGPAVQLEEGHRHAAPRRQDRVLLINGSQGSGQESSQPLHWSCHCTDGNDHGHPSITSRRPPGRRRLGERLRRADATARRSRRSRCCSPHKKKGGRNNQGIVTSRFRGGGHKQMYRIIDFKRTEGRRLGRGRRDRVRPEPHGPHRAASSTRTARGATSSRPDGLKAGDKVHERRGGRAAASATACRCGRIPLGMTVHNVEMQPGRGGQICRSAGTSAALTAREGDWAQITLPSGEVRRVPVECRATIGAHRQRRPHEHQPRQGRPQALDGPQAAQPRHVDEPGQPPDGRRRRPDRGRPASVQPDRRAGQGRQDAQEAEAVERGDHPPPSAGPAIDAREVTAMPEVHGLQSVSLRGRLNR